MSETIHRLRLWSDSWLHQDMVVTSRPPSYDVSAAGNGLLPGTGAETDDSDSLAHTRWDRAYHIVLMPKCGRKAPCGDVRMEAGGVPGRLVEAKDGVEVPGGGVCTDHVHMCLRIAPKHSVPEVMGHLKGKGAPVLFDHHP